MAILKSVVDVNNGNTGWTSGDVLDALETVFANLGFHGGSASSGVPYSISAPNGTVSTRNTAWHAVGRQIYYAWKENGKIESINEFLFKKKIKGKIGTFTFKDKKVLQDLNIYKAENNKFIKF